MVSRTSKIACSLAALTAAFAAAAPAAGANTRYAGPAGSASATCASGDPCRLDTAVNSAVAGDEVILKPGDYNVDYTVSATAAIDIHGEAGQAVPRLIGAGSNLLPTIEMTAGGTISRVFASASANSVPAFNLKGVIADGIEAKATNGGYGVDVYASAAGTIVRNSVLRAEGGAALQVKDQLVGATTVIGVTAIGSAGADGIVVKATQSTTTIKNTIARGTWDIEKKTTALSPAVSYTNFRGASSTGVSAGAGNQDSDPIYVDAAAGDLRPALGSPVIDAGAADAAGGSKDAQGSTRSLGSAPDIGAFESDPSATPPPRGGGDPGSPPPDPTGSTGDPAPTPTPTSDPTKPSTGDGTSPPTDDGGSTGDDGTGSGSGDRKDSLPPETKPVLGASVTLGEVRGATLVRLPGSNRFVPLTADSTVPVGAVVDATRGTIELTSVRDSSGKTQTGKFWGGVFKVTQGRSDTVTELSLAGGDFSDCRTKRRGKVVAAGAKRKRRLWGRDRGGRFRTRGRNGSATVRGTRWLTEDRCDGTYFKVTQGAIDVRDDRKRKTVRLKRGGSYLAAATAKRKKR